MSNTLTPPRRAALAVLALGEVTGRPVYESNVTTQLPAADDTRLTVYWQTRQGLADVGLIAAPVRGDAELHLTDAGRALATAPAEVSAVKGGLTTAREKALRVVGAPGWARIGQGMYESTPEAPVVTPTGASWLVDMGYCEKSGEDEKRLDLTELGLAAFHKLPAEEPTGGDDAGDEPVESAFAGDFPDGELDGDEEEVHTEVVEPEGSDPDEAPGIVVLPLGAIPSYDGQAMAGLDTSFTGTVGSVPHLRIGERAVVLQVVEAVADGHKNTARDGIRATQKQKVLESFALGGRGAQALINNVRESWATMTGVEVLPFKASADAQLTGALGLGEGDAPVMVVFAGGVRSHWPDDFPKGIARPVVAERLDVPGGSDQDLVVELIDFATGKVISTWDDEDAVPDGQTGGAGDEEG